MNKKSFKPIKMLPHSKETVWGGSRLEKEYGKLKGKLNNIAESWELSAICGMESVACEGEFSGKPFGEIYKHFNNGEECPILIKFIDSQSDLSVQVHPSVKCGSALPKNECWYILSSDENSQIAYGFKNKITPHEIFDSISNGTLCDKLNYVNVHPKDFFYVPAGMVHAIGKGITLLEIQQSSDTTYRLYDYDRLDANGNKRELHVDKAGSAVKNFTAEDIDSLRFSKPYDDSNCICSCDYFSVYRISEATDCSSLLHEKNSSVTFISNGSILYESEEIRAKKGETFYIPPSTSPKNIIISAHEAVLTII